MKPIAHRWSEALAGLKLEAIPAIVILGIEGVRQWLKPEASEKDRGRNSTVAMDLFRPTFGKHGTLVGTGAFYAGNGSLAQVCPIISGEKFT
jgi:hypothetical protein